MRIRIETRDSQKRKRMKARRKRHAEPRNWLAWYPIHVVGDNGYYEVVWLSFIKRRWDKGWWYNLGDNEWRRGYMLLGPAAPASESKRKE